MKNAEGEKFLLNNDFFFVLDVASLTVTFMSEWLDINWRKGIDSIQPNVLLM